MSFVIVGIPLAQIIYLLFRIFSLKSSEIKYYYLPLLTEIITYIAIFQISLSITDIQRSILLPFIWSFFEYINYLILNLSNLTRPMKGHKLVVNR